MSELLLVFKCSSFWLLLFSLSPSHRYFYFLQVNVGLYRVPLSVIRTATPSTSLLSSSYIIASGTLQYFTLELNIFTYYVVTSDRLIYKNLTDSSVLVNASNQFISSCASFLDRAYLYAEQSNNWFIVAADGRTAVIIDVGSNQLTGIRMFKSAFQPLPSERSIII